MSHEVQTVDLGDAGFLTISWDVDPFTISEADAAWLLGVVQAFRRLKEHAEGQPSASCARDMETGQ